MTTFNTYVSAEANDGTVRMSLHPFDDTNEGGAQRRFGCRRVEPSSNQAPEYNKDHEVHTMSDHRIITVQPMGFAEVRYISCCFGKDGGSRHGPEGHFIAQGEDAFGRALQWLLEGEEP